MVSNKWLMTRDGSMLKSEISVVVPQLNQDKTWNVLVINKQGIQMPVIVGIDSINTAVAIMDKIVQEIDRTEDIPKVKQEEEEIPVEEESIEEEKEI